MTAPLVPERLRAGQTVGMSDDEFVYTVADFLGWALRSGWTPTTLPIGVVFTFQAPVTRRLVDQPERFTDNTELTVSNARVFMTSDDGASVLVACLDPGAASAIRAG